MQIQTLHLQTSMPKQLAAFYAELMELPVEPFNGNGIVISAGATRLVFQQADKGDPFYHFAFNIPANKIEEARHWMGGRSELIWLEQYKSDVADFVNWHAKSIYFFDPAGNIVELIARFDLNNASEQPFSSQQILSVSEAGLVFKEDELDKRTENIIHQYDLGYFTKQPPLPQFKAVGDDEGLFIIVPENRNWFPTEKPSGIFPMTIYFNDREILELPAM